MKNLVILVLLLPSLVFAVDDATVEAIDSKASSANSKANGNNSRIQALEAEDVLINQRIDNIQLTPGPKGDQGDPGTSCSVTQDTDGATISCGDGGVARVLDGMDGADAPDRTAALCELYGALIGGGMTGELTLPDFCQLPALPLLAVAYINDDGIDGYSETGDTLIAGLYDKTEDGIPGEGDEIRFGQFPTDFQLLLPLGTFLQSSYLVASPEIVNSGRVLVTDINGDDHEWNNQFLKEVYQCTVSNVDDDRITFRDEFSIDRSTDVIVNEVPTGSCGSPTGTMIRSSSNDEADNHFIDVDIFIE